MSIEREIDSLYGLIVTMRNEQAPDIIHVWEKIREDENVADYVRLDILPIELQDKVREIIRKRPKREMAPQTKEEIRLANLIP
jgi:hypothetical protein